MTMRRICDACRKTIATGDPFKELATTEDLEGQRHYHSADPVPPETESCWQAIRQGILQAEQSRRVGG